MRDCPPADTLSQLLIDALCGDDLTRVEAHVERCNACQEALGRICRLGDGPATELMHAWQRELVENEFAEAAYQKLQQLSAVTFAAAAGTAPDGTRAAEWDEWPQVDGYEILGELGRGGMGVVYQARHLALDRPVALKMVLHGAAMASQARQRFRQEARAIGRLHHPNIIQVYDVGEQAGRPFLAMELVSGGTLARRLGGRPQAPRAAAKLVETLARAIQYAHTCGVVHRDLKPANVLLGDSAADAPVVKITDFGLAKDLLADAAPLTQSGAMLGTPSYMAPEQARGRGEPVGPTVDVYALGAILYELLTGRAPFRAATPLDTLVQVVHHDPVPVSRLQPAVPRDLATICQKCLEKEPARRYSSAEALADDLRRFRSDEPILARPIGRAGRLRRWVRRKPALAGTIVCAAALAAIALGAVLWQWRVAVQARNRADALAESERVERDAAASAGRRAERSAAYMYFSLGAFHCHQLHLSHGLLLQAEALVQAAATGSESLESTIRTHIPVWMARAIERRITPSLGAPVTAVAYTADGRRLLTATGANRNENAGPGRAQFWDMHSGQPVGPAMQQPDPIVAATCSPDGSRVITCGATGAVRVWESSSGVILAGPILETGTIAAVAACPDGRRFVTGGVNPAGRGEALVWDVVPDDEKPDEQNNRTAKLVIRHRLSHRGRVNAVAFGTDGKTVLTGCSITNESGAVVGGEAQFWDAASGVRNNASLPHADAVTAVALSPSGQAILTGCADRAIRLWDRKTGRSLGNPNWCPFPISALAFSPAGTSFVVGGGGPNTLDTGCGAIIWDAGALKPRTQILTHPDAIHAVAVRSDGQFVTACEDGRVRWFNVGGSFPITESHQLAPLVETKGSSDAEVARYLGFAWRHRNTDDLWSTLRSLVQFASVTSFAFSPDGRILLTGDRGGTICGWNSASGRPLGPPVSVRAIPWRLSFSHDGSRFLTIAGKDDRNTDQVEFWDTAKMLRLDVVPDRRLAATAVAFHPNGRLAAIGERNGVVRLIDVGGGDPSGFNQLGPVMYHTGPVREVAFDASGQRLTVTGDDGTIRVWVVPPPASGSAAEIQRHIETLTGQKLDSNGGLRPTVDINRHPESLR